MFILICESYPD